MKITEPVLGAPCWVELGTTDLSGAGAFYGALFGWTAEQDPSPEAGGYTMLLLGRDPVAAMTPLYQEGQPVAWTMSVSVADCDAVAERVLHHGGTVMVGPMDIFDLGRFAVVTDPQGAVFQLWQPRTFQGAARMNETGTLCWVELAARDPEAARDFYTAALSWGAHGGTGAGDYLQWAIDGRDFGGMLAMDPERFPADAPQHWTVYFAVDDVDATLVRARELGGRQGFAATDLPGTGRVAGLVDPQGAAFAVFTPERYVGNDRSPVQGLPSG
ncbi:VOC family protein [Streptomyces sp. JJ36]|uniref:VOC family protein n=1 Tax=Streptomyces sp. JJ36 TaxID=2736645 RepID=UPI001F468045|nr:VOC family protein [Streptomyces sp. JJ36]MCF6521525.1 VOC family protein [Streptomyces sp. JJ36]